MRRGSRLVVMSAVIALALLVACSSATEPQANPDSGNSAGEDAPPAMVDSVSVARRDNQFYAVVAGYYPDPCTSISSVEQSVDGNTVAITLLTGRPADLMCAQVLTPFTVDILLTTGGLVPGEFTVVVNDGPETTFLLE